MNKGIIWTILILILIGAGIGVWYWQTQDDTGTVTNITNSTSNLQQLDITANVQRSVGPIYIWGLEPDTGSTVGGEDIVLTGDNILEGARVFFNDVPSDSVTYVSNTELRVVTPTGEAGVATITVSNPDGLSSDLKNGFTYE